MKNLGLVVALTLAATLAGCATPQAQSASVATSAPSSASVSATPTPTPSPTPTIMSIEVAGKYFLDSVCPSNRLMDPMNAAIANKTTTTVNMKAAQAAASAYRDGLTTTVKALSNPKLPWPEAVKKDVDLFVDALYTDVANADAVAGQATATGLFYEWNSWKDSGASTHAKAVRIKLGLPTDGRTSCGMAPNA